MSSEFGIRPLAEGDIPATVRLMTESFPRRTQAYFETAFERLAVRDIPDGFERFGYVIDQGGIFGAVLAIPSAHDLGTETQAFVNISTWCVAPSHRGPAAKALYDQSGAREDAVNTNLSAAKHTLKTIGRLGFKPWSHGQYLALRARRNGKAQVLTLDPAVKAGLPDHQARILEDHRRSGCLTPILESDGRLIPLILLKRVVRKVIPAAQLIYCEDRAWLLEHARPLLTWLRLRGRLGLIIDADSPEPALAGRYFPGLAAKYYRGQSPRLDVDHTYSEMMYLGF